MQVSVEKLSSIERRLTIVVPSEKVEAGYQTKIQEFAKKANIKGFRPGKAPLSYITQQFGADARQEALRTIIENSLFEALTEQKLRPVSAPTVDPKLSEPGQPFEFTATFEILPEIGEIKFNLANLDKYNVEIKDEDIDNVIEQLRKQYTTWKLVDREAKEHDRVVIDYYAIYEGKSDIENKVQNFPLELNSKRMLPGFEEGLIGAKAGEERKLNLVFPADFGMADRAGKPIEFVVDVKQVFEAEKPPLDGEFFKKIGVKSQNLADLQQQIKQSLELERNRLVQEKIKEQVFTALIDQNTLDVPASMIDNEAKRIHDEIHPHHNNHHEHTEEEMSAFKDIGKKRVILGLLINEYAKNANIEVDNDKVKKRIEEIASAYETPAEVVAWLSSDERRHGIEAQVIEDQVLDKLLENVPVTEKNISYAELRGVRL